MKLARHLDARIDYQVSPLIDIVFLLLIYFMVTASLVKKEAEIGFLLPQPSPPIDLPVEACIEVGADGSVMLDGLRYPGADRALDALVRHLAGLKEVAAAQHAELNVSIVPHKETRHGRIMDVMDACSAAGIRNMGFGQSI